MNIEIADRLIELRKKNGFSQEELASKLGLSRQAVSKWERAEASPDTDNLICLAQLYGVSLDELLKTDQSVEDIAAQEKEKQDAAQTNKADMNKEDDEDEETLTPEEKDIAINKLHLDRRANFRRFFDPIIWLSSILIYVVVSGITGLWHPLWLIFFITCSLSTLEDSIFRKTWAWGGYPILISGVYLFLGFQMNLWHPYWFLFLTIPVFYSITSLMDFLTHSGKWDKNHHIRKIYFENHENDDDKEDDD
ncbi:MAG: helix-turn-helix domain-containing protein [Bacilli bacterium]|jgi:transcriptional regulator with XRE-family HTH domain|nr:helix-turn-helix domain-containing protein [Bacilli bacterium]